MFLCLLSGCSTRVLQSTLLDLPPPSQLKSHQAGNTPYSPALSWRSCPSGCWRWFPFCARKPSTRSCEIQWCVTKLNFGFSKVDKKNGHTKRENIIFRCLILANLTNMEKQFKFKTNETLTYNLNFWFFGQFIGKDNYFEWSLVSQIVQCCIYIFKCIKFTVNTDGTWRAFLANADWSTSSMFLKLSYWSTQRFSASALPSPSNITVKWNCKPKIAAVSISSKVKFDLNSVSCFFPMNHGHRIKMTSCLLSVDWWRHGDRSAIWSVHSYTTHSCVIRICNQIGHRRSKTNDQVLQQFDIFCQELHWLDANRSIEVFLNSTTYYTGKSKINSAK